MAEHFCNEHQTIFEKHTKGDKVWYSHKKGGGGWCNEPKETEKPPVVESPKQGVTSEMSKEDWAEKDKTTRKSIERQKALELATNWAIALLSSSCFTKKELLTGRSIIMAARDYEEYLNTGEIPVRLVIEKLEDTARAKAEGKEVKVATKSRLVEEAKRLGAIEIEEKEDSKTE